MNYVVQPICSIISMVLSSEVAIFSLALPLTWLHFHSQQIEVSVTHCIVVISSSDWFSAKRDALSFLALIG